MSCSRIEAMDDFDVRKAALAKTLIEERTQARADLFRAQERVRELEGLLGAVGEARLRTDEWDAAEYGRAEFKTYETEHPCFGDCVTALLPEALAIATKRREGKGE